MAPGDVRTAGRMFGYPYGEHEGRAACESVTSNGGEFLPDLIDRILAWAVDDYRFDSSFVKDLQTKLEEYGRLTDNQVTELEKIIESWHID